MYDLSSIPSPIDSATLTLHLSYRGAVNGMQNAVATLASDDWSEEGVTFATMRAVGDDVALWLVPWADASELINLTEQTPCSGRPRVGRDAAPGSELIELIECVRSIALNLPRLKIST